MNGWSESGLRKFCAIDCPVSLYYSHTDRSGLVTLIVNAYDHIGDAVRHPTLIAVWVDHNVAHMMS